MVGIYDDCKNIELQQYMDDLELLLRSVLSGELYEYIIDSFNKILNLANYDIIVIIARKGYSLYKTFEPLLDPELKKSKVILHDKALGSCIYKLKEYYDFKKTSGTPTGVLVVDDTILYGRTATDIICELVSHRFDENDIGIFALSVFNDILYKGSIHNESDSCDNKIEKKAPYFIKSTDETIFYYNRNYNIDVQDQCVEELGKIKVPIDICFLNESTVRTHSAMFLRAIHATTMPYDSLVPAFTLSAESASGFLNNFNYLLEKQEHTKLTNEREFVSKCFNKCYEPIINKYKIFNITTKDMSDLGVLSVCFAENHKQEDDIYFFVRFYINYTLQIVRIIPYTIFPSISNVNNVYNELRENCFDTLLPIFHDNDDVLEVKTKYRILRYVLSAILGVNFLHSLGLEFSHFPNGDTGKIADVELFPVEKYILEELKNKEIAKTWNDKVRILRFDKANYVEDHILPYFRDIMDTILKTVIRNDIPQRQQIQSYFQQIGEYDKTGQSDPRLDVKNKGELFEVFVDRFAKFNNNHEIDKTSFIVDIIHICDDGKASLYVDSKRSVGNVGLFIQNGEQSGQYLAYAIPGLTLFLSTIYDTIGKDAWENERENIIDSIESYLKNNKLEYDPYIIQNFKKVTRPYIYNLYSAYDIGNAITSQTYCSLLLWYEIESTNFLNMSKSY